MEYNISGLKQTANNSSEFDILRVFLRQSFCTRAPLDRHIRSVSIIAAKHSPNFVYFLSLIEALYVADFSKIDVFGFWITNITCKIRNRRAKPCLVELLNVSRETACCRQYLLMRKFSMN